MLISSACIHKSYNPNKTCAVSFTVCNVVATGLERQSQGFLQCESQVSHQNHPVCLLTENRELPSSLTDSESLGMKPAICIFVSSLRGSHTQYSYRATVWVTTCPLGNTWKPRTHSCGPNPRDNDYIIIRSLGPRIGLCKGSPAYPNIQTGWKPHLYLWQLFLQHK